MLELRGVSAGYGPIQVLHEVSLTVAEGEIVALIGANGAGKSTTLMTVSGIIPCRGGEILLRDTRIDGLAPERIVALGLSQVPEGRHVFAELTVGENLELGAYLRRDPAGVRQDLDYVLGLFPVLAERRRQPAGTLSGGEQQMLAISRALMARPSLLLLDEPSMGLAPLMIRQIFLMVERIVREHGTGVLLVEQNAHAALRLAARGYVLENGVVALAGPAGELRENPAVRRAYLGMTEESRQETDDGR
ncbi:MAG: branched-chain amino acid ABC transporter ATP-binding protein [Desulfobulbaceae bacterium A2]|nr:MAG: branched-chain amino acid ABC transporter ATP-binding protein [Desulfobulbaceae bacterium A2]